MNPPDIIMQVKQLLKSDFTPQKNIPLDSIPQDKLLEYLLFNRNDLPERVRQSYIPSLIEFGFLSQGYSKILENGKTNVIQNSSLRKNSVNPKSTFVENNNVKRVRTYTGAGKTCGGCGNVV